MVDDSQEAERVRRGPVKRQAAKPTGQPAVKKVETVRLQLHLSATTVQRLGVHAALVGRNQSRLADEILAGYLARFGKGRAIFSDSPDVEVSTPAE